MNRNFLKLRSLVLLRLGGSECLTQREWGHHILLLRPLGWSCSNRRPQQKIGNTSSLKQIVSISFSSNSSTNMIKTHLLCSERTCRSFHSKGQSSMARGRGHTNYYHRTQRKQVHSSRRRTWMAEDGKLKEKIKKKIKRSRCLTSTLPVQSHATQSLGKQGYSEYAHSNASFRYKGWSNSNAICVYSYTSFPTTVSD